MATLALAKRSASQEEVAPLSPCASKRTVAHRLSSTLTVDVPSPSATTPGDDGSELINELSTSNQLRMGCRVLIQRAVNTVYMPFPDPAQEGEYRGLALSSHRYFLFLAFLLYGVGMVILIIVEAAGGINTDKEKTGVTYTLVRARAPWPRWGVLAGSGGERVFAPNRRRGEGRDCGQEARKGPARPARKAASYTPCARGAPSLAPPRRPPLSTVPPPRARHTHPPRPWRPPHPQFAPPPPPRAPLFHSKRWWPRSASSRPSR